MDWSKFGLSRDPFERCPELDDACLPNTVASLLSELQSGLRAPQGVSVLVGDSGSGKSIAAAAFARRAASFAEVALLPVPTSSVSAIAREALGLLDREDSAFALDDDWTDALRTDVRRRSQSGRATVLVLDDAHRLSPQSLEDLAALFADDEELRLHVFLFGRTRLLDRMQAGAERALDAHLLQIVRLEPLGVRESVRYLERRLAIAGGELGAMFSDEAIDEAVQKAGGRLQRLEVVAMEALRRAAKRGQTKASAEDVIAIAPAAVVEEEVEPMATKQQPLRFELSDDEEELEAAPEWGDEGGKEQAVEWGDDDEDGEETWQAGEDEEVEEEEEALEWEASPHHLDDEDAEEEEIEEIVRPAVTRGAAAAANRRMVGPAVLSIGACLALVWAANHVPGPAEDVHHGRDAELFAKPLTTSPEDILRLARTAEAADADAQVVAWRQLPAEERERGARHAAMLEARAAALAAEKTAEASAAPAPAATPAVAKGSETMGPSPAVLASNQPAPRSASAPSRADAVVTAKNTRTPSAVSERTVSVSSKRGASPVFTVQLGAFKARRNAEDLATRVRGKPTRILQEGGLYRVMSGSFSSRQDALLHEASLKRAGYTTFIRTATF